jgi:hypothetical protein
MRTKSLLLLTRSSFLMLLLSLGTASAGDTTDPDPVGLPAAAPCNFMECTHEIQWCGSVCDWLFNGTVRSLSLAPRIDDSLVDIALAKQPDIQGALKEPPRSKDTANGNVRISYMTAAAEGAEPSVSETIKPSAETPKPHWSHLPILGAEAEARGHRIPLPFGIGATFYDARQPVNVRDLKLGARNGPPESSTFVKINGPITSWQQNVATRFDVWLFPFFNLYGVAGYTRGNTRGTVTVTGPVLGLLNQDLPLFAEFHGPTVGGGVTLAGGFKVTDWRDLLAFMIGDVNHTVTFLSFKNESLIAHTKPHATVASTRVGLRGEVTKFISAGMWVGAMYQLIQEEVAGSVAGRSIEFIINQRAASPWNTLVGGQIDFGRHFNVFVEGGFGPRSSILTAAVFRF